MMQLPVEAASPDISLVGQGGIAVLSVFLLDWLKKSNWFPWISENSEKINRVISIAIAFGTAVGFKILSHSGDIHSGGIITIAYPSLSAIEDTLGHAITQFGGQEVLHKLLGNHVMDKAILDKLTAMEQQLAQPPAKG